MSTHAQLRLTVCGGSGIPTGSNFLLETLDSSVRLLVDCGLAQGCHDCEERNYEPFPYDPSTVGTLLVTHAHIDHIGRIPRLVAQGFHGKIISTPATRELAALMFDDALGIMQGKARHGGPEPLYNEENVRQALSLWEELEYHTPRDLGNGLSVYLKDAGHILGSAIAEITYNGSKIAFTGDLGNSPSPLLRDTDPVDDVRYLVMESVYGDRNHDEREQRNLHLKQYVSEGIKRGGTIIIPTFSIERTQVLLYELNELVEGRELSRLPVYLDSPLAEKVTEVYRKYTNYFNDARQKEIKDGDDIFDFPGLEIVESSRESQSIEKRGAKLILAGSGMSVGGRILFHEKTYLSDPRNTVIFVGYQVPGTLGRALLDGAKRVHIEGAEVKVRARTESILGYSAHKDSNHLQAFAEAAAASAKRIFVVLGEPKSSLFLAQRIRDFTDVPVSVPKLGDSFILDF